MTLCYLAFRIYQQDDQREACWFRGDAEEWGKRTSLLQTDEAGFPTGLKACSPLDGDSPSVDITLERVCLIASRASCAEKRASFSRKKKLVN